MQWIGNCLYSFIEVENNGQCPEGDTCYITHLECCIEPSNESIPNCDGYTGSDDDNSNNDSSDDDSNNNSDYQDENATTGSSVNGDDSTTSQDYVDAPVAVLRPKPECNKIQDLFNDYTNLKDELMELDGLTSETEEKGKYIANNSTVINDFITGANGVIDISSATTIVNKYYMIAHTHNSPADSTYSVFSWFDFYAIKDLLNLNKIETSKFVFYVMTADGTRYAMTINNKNKFLKFFATILDENFDSITNITRVTQRDKYYAPFNLEIKPLIVVDSDDNEQDLKYFLSFLQDNDLGLKLFEVDESFNTFKKLKYNKQTDNIDRTACN